METDAIIRDSGKLCSRLFDHRHVINPEIHQFVNEFETKKAKKENQYLDASLAAVTEMTQTQLPNTALLIDDGTPKLIGSLQVGARMIERIVEKRGVDSFAGFRQAKRQERAVAWNAFMEQLCVESNEIEAEYEQSKEKTKQYYDELNQQLKL